MSSVTQRRVKVLLVEHDPDGTGGLRGSLDGAHGVGFDVEQVGELSVGLERLTQEGVDVMLLDLFLPDSQGMTTFERAHAFAPHVPIVVMTREASEELGATAVQGGAQDYLVRDEVEPSEVIRSLRYAIERHRLLSDLRSLSLIDELTGLYNRQGFTQLGEQYLKLARRSGRGGALLHVDVDRFRTINEALGHHVGDRALLEVARVFHSAVRSSDLTARLTADRFAVLALESTAETSDVLVERIRASFESLEDRAERPYHLSVSVGVARFEPGDTPGVEELMDAAAADLRATRGGSETPR